MKNGTEIIVDGWDEKLHRFHFLVRQTAVSEAPPPSSGCETLKGRVQSRWRVRVGSTAHPYRSGHRGFFCRADSKFRKKPCGNASPGNGL